MRPILFTLGPWPLFMLPLLAGALAALLSLWTWLDARQRGERARPLDYAAGVGGAIVAALALFFLVNHFGPVAVRSYGFMLLVAMAAALLWMNYDRRRCGLPSAFLVDLGLACLVAGIIGARLIYVALDWNQFAAAPRSIFKVWEGGLSFHGGLLGGIGAAYVLARMRGIKFSVLVDLASPALALGYAFARIGCFLNGCCFGGACTTFWGVRFAPGSEAAAFSLRLPPGQVAPTWGNPLYPTQLLDCAVSLIVFGILVALRRPLRRPGHLFLAYLGLYAVERFVVELWRAGASGRPFPGVPFLTWAQMASVAMLAVVALILALTWPKKGEGAAQASVGVAQASQPASGRPASGGGAGLEACATQKGASGKQQKKKDKRK